MRISHWASCFTSSSRERRSSWERSGLSSTAEVEPMMEVRGVRISWDTERSRSARIRIFSFSIRSLSNWRVLVVRAEVMTETLRKVRKDRG